MAYVIDDISESINIFQIVYLYISDPWCQNIRNYIHARLSSPWTVVTDVTNKLFDTFPITALTMLNIEPQIEIIVFHLNKTIQ